MRDIYGKKLELGDPVEFRVQMVAQPSGYWPTRRRLWIEVRSPTTPVRHGIYIGYRTVYEGDLISVPDEPSYLAVTKSLTFPLVVIGERTAPIYVREVELITGPSNKG